jgi:hypothetical protein
MEGINKVITNVKALRVLQFFLILLTAFTIITSSIFLFSGYMDAPCSVHYNEADHCINVWLSGLEPRKEAPLIESFLTTYSAGFGGGGCYNRGSNSNVLDLRTDVGKLHLEREGDSLKVEGKELLTGSEFRSTNYLYWHPWLITRLEFKNMGLIVDCESNTSHKRIVIYGRSGTEFSLAKGFLSLSIFIGGLVYVSRNLRKLRGTKKPHGINTKAK